MEILRNIEVFAKKNYANDCEQIRYLKINYLYETIMSDNINEVHTIIVY